jgi:hypothetical protein
MNRHVGASFTLSVLVVVFFAVALYPLERKPASPVPELLSSEPLKSPRPAGPPPEPTPGVPLTEPPALPTDEPPHVAAGEPTPGPSPAKHATSTAIATSAPPRVRVVSRTRALSAPRSAFTLVVDGESLDDVAARVYGTTEKAEWLWLSNRDLIARKDASLHAGMLLRTP